MDWRIHHAVFPDRLEEGEGGKVICGGRLKQFGDPPARLCVEHQMQTSEGESSAGAGRGRRPGSGRVPWFAIAASLLFLICIIFAIWPVVDAQYLTALRWFRVNVGVESVEVHPFAREIGLWSHIVMVSWQWDRLGSRLILLSMLSMTSVVAAVFSLFT